MPIIVRHHQIDRGFLAIELFPDHDGAVRPGDDVGARRASVGLSNRKRVGERFPAIPRARVEQALAKLPVRVPGHMVGARRRDRQAGPVMRARRDLPIVPTDTLNLARRRGIDKRHYRVIPDAAVEDVPEDDDRTPGSGKGDAQPAALAGVVLGHMRPGICCASVSR